MEWSSASDCGSEKQSRYRQSERISSKPQFDHNFPKLIEEGTRNHGENYGISKDGSHLEVCELNLSLSRNCLE